MSHALAVPQPEYRALMILPALPKHCTAIMCRDDRSMPHIRAGEWAVVDPSDRTPRHGELLVVRFGPGLYQQHICMVRRRKNVGWCDQSHGPDGWTIGAVSNDECRRLLDRLETRKAEMSHQEWARAAIEINNRTGAWVEGPYQDAGKSYDHLCSIIVGSVIGIYAPTFEGPTRGARS